MPSEKPTMTSNQAPKPRWFKDTLACGTVRHRLYLNGAETPYFIDVARYQAHRSYGSVIGLWGSGLGKMTQAGYRIAGFFGGFEKISVAKHRAEQLAMGA